MNCYRNQSFSTQLNLILCQLFFFFSKFLVFSFGIHYRTKGVVCHPILKVNVQHNSESYAVLCFCSERDNPSQAQGIHNAKSGHCLFSESCH